MSNAPKGIVMVLTDDRGVVFATATDFHRDRPSGYSIKDAQERRAERALARDFLIKLCHPIIPKLIDEYQGLGMVRTACSEHGWRLTTIAVGYEEGDAQ